MKKTKYILAVLCGLMLSFMANASLIPAGLVDSGDELWTLTDSNAVLDDSGFEMLFEFGQFNTFDHTFGFYQVDSGGAMLNSLDIFRSIDGVGSTSNLVWDLGSNLASTMYGTMSLTSNLEFGFYFISDFSTYFSQASLNGGTNYMDFYWQPDIFDVNNLYIKAWDNGSGANYDEVNIGISDVSRVGPNTNQIPEPSSIALMGLAVMGLAVRRKKQ